MNSQKGMGILQLVYTTVALMIITAVAVYVLIGPNGVLNREEVPPLPTTTEEQTNTVD